MKTRLIAGISLLAHPLAGIAYEKPDIIYILADDLGFADVGFNGSDIQTPNLDRIARQGVQLNNYYVCPVSSPTRAGLMTGRYPIHFGMMRAVVKPDLNFGVDTNEEMLPEMLAKAGYDYRGAFGKWHLGHHQTKWLPHNRGFTQFIGCYNGAIDYFKKTRNKTPDWHHNGKPLKEAGYSTDLIGQHTVEFIESVPKDKPYFAYVAFNAPHAPFDAKPEDIAKYPNIEDKKKRYAAMVDCMDQNIGKILEAAEKRGNLDNTFIVFSSDNGGVKAIANNGLMRSGKTYTYEGGIRVAACAMWEKGGITGGKIIRERMGYIDMFPTFKHVAYNGKKMPKAKNPLDGENVLDLMKGKKRTKDRIWFSYLDYDSKTKTERLGVNYGDWKLVVMRPAPDNNKPGVATVCELFKLDDKNQEVTVVENKEMEAKLLKSLEEFLSDNKQKKQVGRSGDGIKGFKPEPDWEPTR
ncbi:MAG: sulfatase-like hydrolase/transferase [Rikenellaceae bacterium]